MERIIPLARTAGAAWPFLATFPVLLSPSTVLASSENGDGRLLDLTGSGFGIASIVVFALAYALVFAEGLFHLRKSKPVVVASGVIWTLIGIAYAMEGDAAAAAAAIRHNLLEYAELLLFLIAAMTYVNTMEERNVFHALRARLVSAGLSLRSIFWITGLLAFFISPFADNLTTALVIAAVVIAAGEGHPRFVALAAINVVVAANAGGAFSPFGDITTLLVWQKGAVRFLEFFDLFVPALINWLVPALILSLAVPKGRPNPARDTVALKPGALGVVGLFLLTIAMAVSFQNFLHLPPVLGMMTGLGLLKINGHFLRRKALGGSAAGEGAPSFDIFAIMKRVEWDTLLFFYGVILCVGGLSTIGYLASASHVLYVDLGPTAANVLVGLMSAIVDNIPIMFAVLTMHPEMSHGQWLLVTLTAGVGGSLLSVGSAAGVALMGQAPGVYTFISHLRWTWAIALGYALSVWAHFLINARLM
ncbi:MAG TPA: sodium:proton antiporter NhaD [Nitrospiria bacterium]|nr:sodium:proton antiporter NhaD [Nitrospiria bacterium]